MRKRTPPYTKTVIKKNPSILKIYAAKHAWELANRSSEAFGNAVALPEGDAFQDYTWPVKRRSVFVFDLDLPRIKTLEVMQLLFEQGAVDVTIDQNFINQGVFYGERKK